MTRKKAGEAPGDIFSVWKGSEPVYCTSTSTGASTFGGLAICLFACFLLLYYLLFYGLAISFDSGVLKFDGGFSRGKVNTKYDFEIAILRLLD